MSRISVVCFFCLLFSLYKSSNKKRLEKSATSLFRRHIRDLATFFVQTCHFTGEEGKFETLLRCVLCVSEPRTSVQRKISLIITKLFYLCKKKSQWGKYRPSISNKIFVRGRTRSQLRSGGTGDVGLKKRIGFIREFFCQGATNCHRIT